MIRTIWLGALASVAAVTVASAAQKGASFNLEAVKEQIEKAMAARGGQAN